MIAMKSKKKKKSYLRNYKSKAIKTLATNYLEFGHTWLQIWWFGNAYFELIGEKKKNLNKFKSMKDNSPKSNLAQVIYQSISVSFKFKLQNGKNTSKIKVKISIVGDIV